MASVEFQTPDGVIRVRLEGDHYTIGRLATNDIALPYPHISRQHAELRLLGQTWWVVDLRSMNGLHVGGQRVSECKLTPEMPILLSPLVQVSLLPESAPHYPPAPRGPVDVYSQPVKHHQPVPQPVSQPMTPQMAPQTPHLTPHAPQQQARQIMPQMAPYTHVPPNAPTVPPGEPVKPLSASGPRSPYADDEAPFYPQMRPVQPTQQVHPTYAPAAAHMAPTSPYPPSAPHAYRQTYAQPPTPPPPQSAFDPQAQSAMVYEQRRTATSGPSPLLHVCQTCGQRTSADAVYCQNCRHSIATECVRCRLSLLPVQDLCPRCQSPNPAAARRAGYAGWPS